MPRMTDDEIRMFLDEPAHLVRIATIDDDGWPRVVPTWFIRQDDDIVFTPRSPTPSAESSGSCIYLCPRRGTGRCKNAGGDGYASGCSDGIGGNGGWADSATSG
jgi:hypothetical protein